MSITRWFRTKWLRMQWRLGLRPRPIITPEMITREALTLLKSHGATLRIRAPNKFTVRTYHAA